MLINGPGVLWMNVLSCQRGISEAKWHVGQEVYLLVIPILLFVDLLHVSSCPRKMRAERAVVAGRLLIGVALAGAAERSILCQRCSANTLAPEKLEPLRLDTCWL